MKKILHKIFKGKDKKKVVIPAMLVVAVCLVFPVVVKAFSLNPLDYLDGLVINLMALVANALVYVISQLLLIFIDILIKVAGFNEFVGAHIVEIGWVILRDVANMIIVVGLLIIAFYTVINKQNYHYRTMLPKLVIAAVLVNFSKTIAGLAIDVGQVVMMYFVHAFDSIAAGNITYGLGIDDMVSVRNTLEQQGGQNIDDINVMGALVLAVVLMIIALIVIISMVIMLTFRIVRLWLLIIFSPLAFAATILPGGEKYFGQWRDDFVKQLTFGPALAFLFWLSMMVLSEVTQANRVISLQMDTQNYLRSSGQQMTSSYEYFASRISSPQRLFDYLVTVVLFIITMTFAKQAGVMGASVAGNLETRVKKFSSGLGRKAMHRVGTSKPAQGSLAALQRLGRTRAGRFLGGDRDYSQKQVAKRKAWAQERAGGIKGAIERDQWARAMDESKKMKDAGDFKTRQGTKKAFESALKSNNLEKAMAAMDDAASKKILTPEMAKRFEENFGGKNLDQDQRAKGYVSQAWDTQQSAGDDSVMFKRTVDVNDITGKYERREAKDNVDAVKKSQSNKDTRNYWTASSIKGFMGAELDNDAANENFNILAEREDLGALSSQERKQTIKRGLDVLAKDQEEGILGDNDELRKNIRGLVSKLQGIESGNIEYNTRTGKLDMEADKTKEEYLDKIDGGNKVMVGNAYMDDDQFEQELRNRYAGVRKKATKKGKEERVTSSYEDSAIEKAFKKNYLKKRLGKKNASFQVQKINPMEFFYQKRREILAEKDPKIREDKIKELSERMQEFKEKMKDDLRVNNIEIGVVNPNTGENYTGDELLQNGFDADGKPIEMGELTDTGFYANINNIIQSKEEETVLNSLDSFLLDMESASGYLKDARQDVAKRNASEMRLALYSNLKDLSSAIKGLGGPQERSTVRGVMKKTGIKKDTLTKGQLRVKKIIKNLERDERVIDGDQNIKDYIKELKEYEKNYRTQKGDERQKIAQKMQELVERIITTYET